MPNMTGTALAYRPPGALEKGGKRAPATRRLRSLDAGRMNWRRVVGIGAALAGAGAAGWAGYDWYLGQQVKAPTAVATPPATTLDEADVAGGVETVDVSGDPTNPETGTTPMKDRVAVLGLLNKRNGQTRDLTLKPGQATRIGNVVVRLRACEQTGTDRAVGAGALHRRVRPARHRADRRIVEARPFGLALQGATVAERRARFRL